MKALLIGREPDYPLGHTYVRQGEHEGVVIGSLSVGQLLHFGEEAALEALCQGKPVILYEPGLPACRGSRALAATLAARRRELKSWGVVFTHGCEKKLITATEARAMVSAGRRAEPGAVLTPLAREILEGK